jgi:hypothetical protein
MICRTECGPSVARAAHRTRPRPCRASEGLKVITRSFTCFHPERTKRTCLALQYEARRHLWVGGSSLPRGLRSPAIRARARRPGWSLRASSVVRCLRCLRSPGTHAPLHGLPHLCLQRRDHHARAPLSVVSVAAQPTAPAPQAARHTWRHPISCLPFMTTCHRRDRERPTRVACATLE